MQRRQQRRLEQCGHPFYKTISTVYKVGDEKATHRGLSAESEPEKLVMIEPTPLTRQDFLGGGGGMVDKISVLSISRLGLRVTSRDLIDLILVR
jgi:hypothetical protein